MFINPKTAIQQGWVKFPDSMSEELRTQCIQPNALDITADRVSRLVPTERAAHLSETSKGFHNLEVCEPDADGYIHIIPHGVYDIHSDFFVNIPNGAAGELVIRSTLNRAGLALNSGIWDSGYIGHLGCVLHNRTDGVFKLKLHTRVCQLKFIRSEISDVLYSGGYNHVEGTHWKESSIIAH